ncbi:MAG: hypothetical protein CMM61_05985 [Rhodospirillaceae bacterium]|nr:hypothetical protein [Rhodospirillaceae bacterium]
MLGSDETRTWGSDLAGKFRIFAVSVLLATSIAFGSAQADDAARELTDRDGLSQAADIQLSQAEDDANDPLEDINRAIFSFNEGVQSALLRPLADAYNSNVPATGRQALKNMFDNLSSPITFVNDILQFEFERALVTFTRAFINTTFGMAGISDLASEMGFEKHQEDFGQTLAVWGVGEGFYVVLPLLGPSNPRDAVGRLLVDGYFEPLSYYLDNIDEEEIDLALHLVDGFLEYADVVEELDQIRKTSVDYYAAIRSLYRQKRNAEISNGQNLDLPPIPDLSPEIRGEMLPNGAIDNSFARLQNAVQ